VAVAREIEGMLPKNIRPNDLSYREMLSVD
jgi:hypothetical protein